MASPAADIIEILDEDPETILERWVESQVSATTMRPDLIDEEELKRQSSEFLSRFRAAVRAGNDDLHSSSWDDVRDVLEELARTRASQGFTPRETAIFVFSLKEPLFAVAQSAGDGPSVATSLWRVSTLLDGLGLYTTELHQKAREDVIRRQQKEILELSTPVVKLWEGAVAVPLIGTLDSERTQTVMESLLQMIVDTGARVAIIDITGVPTVDTLVAQHLIKTVSAARLMGAECIISGIRPQIAQTIVHLGIDLDGVPTKATLGDAISLAFQRLGFQISRRGS